MKNIKVALRDKQAEWAEEEIERAKGGVGGRCRDLAFRTSLTHTHSVRSLSTRTSNVASIPRVLTTCPTFR